MMPVTWRDALFVTGMISTLDVLADNGGRVMRLDNLLRQHGGAEGYLGNLRLHII